MPPSAAPVRAPWGTPPRRASMVSTQTALVGGFAVVFSLWLAWGYRLSRDLQDIERSVAGVHDAYVHGEQTLSRIRTNVLLSSIYVRDALLDSATPRRNYRGELSQLRTEVDAALSAYLPKVVSDDEREHWLRLQNELTDFWASRDMPFLSDATLRQEEASALLRGRIAPRRETILGIVDELSALQSQANDRRQAAAQALHRAVRLRMLSMGGLTLFAALIVAVAASRHVGRLQREIDRQRTAETQNLRDLERLSARLVDAQEQERRALARELHDEVGQALTAVKMDIGIALRAHNPAAARAALEEARHLAETTLHSVRDLSQLLHPSLLDDFGLSATLTTYLRSFAQRTGIDARMAETIDLRLASATEVCVYRIVQEALNNITQHSGASSCIVSLRAVDDTLHLAISDNGRGLTRPQTAAPGLGLIGMRERAQSLGGTFRILSHGGADSGARIEVTLPLVIAPATVSSEPELRTGSL